MKRVILILFCVIFLSACQPTALTFKGNSTHWEIEMNVTNPTLNGDKQDITVIYKYKGQLSQLQKYKHLELSFNTIGAGGGETINTNKGLDKKIFTVTLSVNGVKIKENAVTTATVILGKNGLKETTKLVRK